MIDAAVILVIEDDPFSLELARYLLEMSGHRPITADNGGDGLRLALGGTCDLVLCDLQMPVLDGFQVVSALLANPHWSRVPVIAVTALSMEGDREMALAAGFDGYMSKPIVPETFVAEVEAYLPPSLRRTSTAGG